MKKSSKVTLAIISLVCGLYVVSPDPIPLGVDDIIVGLMGAVSFFRMLKSTGGPSHLQD